MRLYKSRILCPHLGSLKIRIKNRKNQIDKIKVCRKYPILDDMFNDINQVFYEYKSTESIFSKERTFSYFLYRIFRILIFNLIELFKRINKV